MQWHKVKVGQIVKVYQDQFFPCDLLIINSSLPRGVCYIETKNLDGESNLKCKQAAKECLKLALDDQSTIINFQPATIECEKPNEFLYTFNGSLMVNKDIVAID